MAVSELKAGVVLNYVNIVLHMIVGLVFTPFLLRMLGQSEYGLYSLAASVIAYLTVLDLGFGNAIVRYTSKFRAEGKRKEQEEMFGMFLILYVLIGLIAVACGAVLASNVDVLFSRSMTEDEISRTRIMLWLMTANLAITFPMSIWGSIMTAYERFIFQRVISIIRGVANPLVMMLLLFIGYKAVAMVVVTTAFNILSLLINYWYCIRKLGIKVRFGRISFPFLREVSIFSFWIFLHAITDRFYWSSGQLILGIYQGATVVAVFAIAIQLKEMFYLFSGAISQLFLPRVTTMVTKGCTQKEMSDLFIKTGRIQYIVISFILCGFIILGRPFIHIWAGTEYDEAYFVSILLFVSTTIPLIQSMGQTILQAKNQMKFRALWVLGVSLISLVLMLPMVRLYSLMGCAFVLAVAIILGYGVGLNIYYRKAIGIDVCRFWKEIFKMSILPIFIMIAGLFITKIVHIESFSSFFAAALILAAVYLPCTYKFVLNDYERNMILKPIHRMIK